MISITICGICTLMLNASLSLIKSCALGAELNKLNGDIDAAVKDYNRVLKEQKIMLKIVKIMRYATYSPIAKLVLGKKRIDYVKRGPDLIEMDMKHVSNRINILQAINLPVNFFPLLALYIVRNH